MNHILNKLTEKVLFISNRVSDKILDKQYPLLNPYLRKKAISKEALGVVLMLHRVAEYDKSRLVPNEDLKVSPAFLQKTIDKYRKTGFAFLSLDEVYDVITGRNKIGKPFVAFTLDDGYLDNYTTAYPIFKQNHVPFCIFVATDFPDKRAILWWISIEDLILSNNELRLSDGSTFICKTYQQKWDTFRLLREKILRLDQRNLHISLQKLFADYQINWLDPIQKMAMTWDNIRELGKEPLCIIGGHTVSHPAFTSLSLDEIREEIDGGINRLKTVIEYDIHHFAYPYGSSKEDGEREYEFLKSFSFKIFLPIFEICSFQKIS